MPQQRPGPPGSGFSARICPSGWIRWLRLAVHLMWVEPRSGRYGHHFTASISPGIGMGECY